MDPSAAEDERKESMASLLKNLCDNHHLEPNFNDDHYNNMFNAIMLMHQNVTNENKMTFEERLEYLYKVADRENEVEPRCLHNCIKNETYYTDCMKRNIFVTMLFHSLHCDSHHMHKGIHGIFAEMYNGQQINFKKSDKLDAEKIDRERLFRNLERFLKFKFNFNQMRNPHKRSFASIDTPKTISPYKSFEKDSKSSNPNEINKSSLVNDENIAPQLTEKLFQVDIELKNERNAEKPADPSSITTITAANFENNPIFSELDMSNISSTINIGENSLNVYTNLSSIELKTFEKKERDVSSLENEQIRNVSTTTQVLESESFNPMLLKNETEISLDGTEEKKEKILKDEKIRAENVTDEEKKKKILNDTDTLAVKNVTEENILNDMDTKADNFTVNVSTLLYEGMKAEDQEINLIKQVLENDSISSHDKGKSEVIVKGATDGNKTGQNNENSIILNKDVKVDNKKLNMNNKSTSCSGTCTDQEESFESAENVPNTSSRLVYGITALLIVLGLAAGATTIYFFIVRENHVGLPCSRRSRSNLNINEPPQSRG